MDREEEKIGININDAEVLRFNKIINDNLEYIESKCFFIVNSKGYFHNIRSDSENEAIELFNLVISELKKNSYKAIRSFKRNSKFSTYLSGIISFTYVDYIRRKRGRKSQKNSRGNAVSVIMPSISGTVVKDGYIKGKDRIIEIPNGNNGPEKEMIEAEQERIKREALRKISEKLKGEEKLLLKMRFPSEKEIDPISVKDISKILGISEKAVYKRIKKALQKCRLILNEVGISVGDIFGEKK